MSSQDGQEEKEGKYQPPSGSLLPRLVWLWEETHPLLFASVRLMPLLYKNIYIHTHIF